MASDQWCAVVWRREEGEEDVEVFGPMTKEQIDAWAEDRADQSFTRLLLTPLSDPDAWQPVIEGTAEEITQAYTVKYGPPKGYCVREEATGAVVFASDLKGDVILRAQELNGWPATGDEQDYVKQSRAAREQAEAAARCQ